jgi:hypothetical protein
MSSKMVLLATHLGIGQKAVSRLTRHIHAHTGTRWSHEDLYILLLPHSGPLSFERIVELVRDHEQTKALANQLSLSPESLPIMLERLQTTVGFPVLRADVIAACNILGETAHDQNELRAFFRIVYRAGTTPEVRSTVVTTIQAMRALLTPPPSYQMMEEVWRSMSTDGQSPSMEHFKIYVLVDAAVRKHRIAGGGIRYLERVWAPQARDLTLHEIATIVQEHPTLDKARIHATIRFTRFAKKNAMTPEALLTTARNAFRNPNMTTRNVAEVIDILNGVWETVDDLVAYSDFVRSLHHPQIDDAMIGALVRDIKHQLPSHRSLAALQVHVQVVLSSLPTGRPFTLQTLITATVQVIRNEDDLQRIARCLALSSAATRDVVVRIQQSMKPPMSLHHIATFIAALPPHQQTSNHVIRYFEEYATETALRAHLTPTQCDRIVATVAKHTRHRVEPINIVRAVKHTADCPAADRVDEVIAYLLIQHQEHTVTHPQALRASLRKHLPQGTFRDVLHHLGLIRIAEYRTSTLDAFYARNVIAFCVSQVLAIPLADSQARIKGLNTATNSSLSLKHILETLHRLPSDEQLPDVLFAYLAIEHWLTQQQIKGYTPATLRTELSTRQQRVLPYPDIDHMLQKLPTESWSLDDLTAYATLAKWIPDPATTRMQINRNLPNSITYCDMREFWQHTPTPAMTSCDDAITFFRMLPPTLRHQPWVQHTDEEVWATADAVTALVATRWRRLNPEAVTAATRESRQDWRAITSEERLYAIPARGYAEIQVHPDVVRRTGITALRFIQEYSVAPAVRIRATLIDDQHPTRDLVGWITLDRDGDTSGFHQQMRDPSYATYVHTMVLAYYRDLVVPTIVMAISQHWTGAERASKPLGYGSSGPPRTEPTPRSLPRQRIDERRTADLAEWHHAQERARHGVVAHTRWVRAEFRADPDKVREAARAGIQLTAGHTWVRDHERGAIQEYGRIILNGYELVHPMLFTAPTRATRLLRSFLG